MINLNSNVQRVITDNEDTIFVGDIGKTFHIYSGIDLSSSTSVLLKVKKPNGTEVDWSAEVDDDNPRYVDYVTVDGDLDLAGTWQVQIYVTFSGEVHRGSTAIFEVHDPFYDNVNFPEPH